MLSGPTMRDLLDYTAWQRRLWLEWLGAQQMPVLEIAVGRSGDGRFETVGDLIKHIFSAEKRYVDRLLQRPITDTAAIPANNLDALFGFGDESRRDLRAFVEHLRPDDGDTLIEFKLMNSSITASRRKIVTHVLMHEIRHWAQIATLCRIQGLKTGFQDFLFSPAMGGDLKREQHTA